MEFGEVNTNRMIDLYVDVPNQRLKKVFSIIHFEINELLKFLNEKLPRNDYGSESEYIGHYNADESRELIKWIDQISEIQSNLKGTKLNFQIERYYNEALQKCNEFLQRIGGSPIPNGIKKIQLALLYPIFIVGEKINIIRKDVSSTFDIKYIGEGSYAKVFKYKDEFYNRHFVIKRAKEDLTDKEYDRFRLEFKEMKDMKSPYVIEVYKFDDDKRQYYMEYMDVSLYDYIQKNNSKLNPLERKKIVFQVLRGFEYIHSKKLLHRDISLKNVLLKLYHDVIIVKISDFGLVKTPDSTLTSILTEFKGSLNDPDLELYGFSNYNIRHETYALTRLIYFVMTGKTIIEKLENSSYEKFIEHGLNKDLKNRYQNIQEIRTAFQNITGV